MRGSKKESWQAKRKRQEAEAKVVADKKRMELAKQGHGWTKGSRFTAIGSIQISREMMDITLSFTGVTRNNGIFRADVVQTGQGWSVAVTLNGTARGSFESEHSDLRAAVISAVDRFA